MSQTQKPAELDADSLVSDPSLFLAGFDFQKGAALIRRIEDGLTPKGCRLTQDRPGYMVGLDNLLQLKLDERLASAPPIGFIWMTDYCMSSLYAKALHALGGFYLYNENVVFSQLAQLKRAMLAEEARVPEETFRRLLRIALVLHAKNFGFGALSLLKEWPLSNLLIPEILSENPDYRAVFLYGSLEEYLGKCLKDPNRRALARGRVTEVFDLRSIPALAHISLGGLEDAEAAALHWLYLIYEMGPRLAAAGGRLKTLSSARFAEAPGAALAATAEHFARPAAPEAIDAVLAGPVFATHAKNTGEAFNLDAHAADLAATRARLEGEIERGLAFAAGVMERTPAPGLEGWGL